MCAKREKQKTQIAKKKKMRENYFKNCSHPFLSVASYNYSKEKRKRGLVKKEKRIEKKNIYKS